MLPTLSLGNIRHGRLGNTIFVCDCLLGSNSLRAFATNFSNLPLCELGGMMCVPALVASFVCHILIVVSMSTKKQMGRIDTSRIVATMANAHAVWNWAIVKLITVAMRKHAFTVDSHLPVTKCHTETCPFPTIIGTTLIDLRPKVRGGMMNAMVIDESKRLTFDPTITLIVARGKVCQLTATALAVTVWDFVRGIIEGHRNLLGCGVKSQDVSASLGQLVCISIIPYTLGAR